MNLFYSLLLSTLSLFSVDQQNDTQLKETPTEQTTFFSEDVPPFSNCPASPHPTIINQPNNTTITIMGKGNMVNHWTETIDGYTIVLNNGIYEYANKINGNLVASGVLAHDPIDRTPSENSFVNSLPKSSKPTLSPLNQSILNQVRNRVMSKTFPTTGNIKVLALLIDYPNLQSTFAKSNFDSLLYASNYRSGDGSFKYYYETSSDSAITIDVDVRGWFRAANNYLYYSRDSGTSRAADLVREAVDAAETAGVNFANYDNNNDNRVDGILAVHAGPGAEQGSRTQYIWSHRWVLAGGSLGAVTYDGKLINDYMINPEIRTAGAAQNLVGIGVFCHEFGHNIGLPDLYDTDNSNGDSEGIGNWCLMAGGGWLGGEHRPANFSAWCRIENTWATPSNLTIGNSSSHTMQPSVNNQNEIYRINTALSNEYFLLENRQKQGLDVELPGEGLAVWHINTNKTNAPGNSVNADENLKGVDLEEADGNNDLDNEVNRGDGGDLFPGSSNNSTFDDSSSPNAKTYTNANTGLQLRNISEVGSTVSFDFGPAPVVTCSGNSNQTAASSTFDDGSGTGTPYANNLNCSWLIQPTSGPINLSFNRFDLDNGGDTLYLYDGANSSASLIGKYTGTTSPPAAVSTGNSLFLEFITDGSTTALGWEVSYTSSAPSTGCSGTTNLAGVSGTFEDGSGPGVNYNDNLNCSWQIDGTLSTIQLQFDSLDIESTNDSLIIYAGQNNTAPIAAIITDNSQATTLTLNSRYAFVEFNTNATINARGWQISWLGRSGCNGPDTLNSPSGTFTDGTLPTSLYGSFSSCEWLIQPAGARLVILDFNRFDTERNFDFVEVYDGTSIAAPRIARLSGNSIPNTIVANSGSMFVRFTSDLSINYTGFEATYTSSSTQCLPTQLFTANSGNFSDGSNTLNYQDNLNCGWSIQPARADTIKINFTAFDTESTNDVVNIYNGVDNSGTLVASYSGNSIPPQTIVAGTQVDAFVEFVTNGTVNNAGWDLTYTSSRRPTCTGTDTLTAASGSFTDGSGTFNYDNSLNCGWLIQPAGNPAIINLDFNSINLVGGFNQDFVRIYDGTDNTGTLLGTRSGTFTGATLTAFSGAMYLEFITNTFNTSQGWSVSYNSSPSFCLSSSTLTANFGSISDGSPFNQNYQANTDCSWLIQPIASNVAVRFQFNQLSTELNNDTITLYDGSTTNAPILATVSGSTLPPSPFTSSGGTMLITFKSNGTNQFSGFSGFYQTQPIPFCAGQTNLTAVSGSFDDGSPVNSNYVDNSNCSWLIQPPSASLISLQFNRFLTLPGDTVNVYDGSSTSAPKLGSFSGVSLPPSLNSSGGSMLVTFNSNAFSNTRGWAATYNSTNSQCFGNITLTNARDTIRDGSGSNNYTNNLNCNWLIQPTSATSITLNFLQFDVDNPGDSLLIYDGVDNTAPRLASLSGSSLPSSVTSSGGDMFVEFITDGSNTAQGWEAFYDITSNLSCIGTTTLTAPNGSFDDGSGPSANYDNSLNCSWLIQPPGSPASITLNFNSMNTAGFNDRVTVYDGSNNSGTILGTFFINNTGGTLTAFSGSMYLEFTTDMTGTAGGWDATYSSSASFCAANTTLTAPNGIIDDGSPFNQNYLNNTSCQWQISPGLVNQAIRFNFLQFNTQAGSDTVTFYDGTSTADPILGSFSGTSIPPTVTSSGGDLLITFNTDNSITANGWRGSYQSVPLPTCNGQTTLTAASGSFDDGSGPTSNYSDNLNCSWLIQPPGAITINLTFNNFRTEAGFDFVRVYDGTNSSGTLLGTFSGSSTPASLQATTGSMFVEFTSDISVTAQGWDASYTSSSNANLTASPDTITINAALGSQNTFSVSSNTNWTTSDNSAWMLANPINGNRNQNVTVIAVQPNIGPIRYGEVYVATTNNTIRDTVVVEQLSSGRYLIANPDTLFFQANPSGSQAINLVTNVNWSLNTTFPWITIGTNSGSNNGNSQINVTSNSGAQRIGYVVASGNLGVNNDTIFIKQDPAGLILNVDPSNLTLAQPMGSTGSFTVNSNLDWQTSTPASWLSIQNPAVTSDTNTVGVTTTSMNSNPGTRSSYVAVQDLAGTVFDTVFVTQLGGNLVLSANPDFVTLGANMGSSANSVLTSNVNWTATLDDPVNFDVNPKSGNGNSTLLIEALTSNSFANPRNSFIVLEGANGAIRDTIFISQNGQPITLSANPKVVNLNQAANSVDSFRVTSNFSWNATSAATWVSPNVTAFPVFGDTTIILTSTSANTSGPTRTTFMALQDILGSRFDTVIINQTGTNPILEANQDTVYLDGEIGSTANVTFLSNGVWSAVEGDPWFSSSLNTNSGNGNLTLTANSDNNGPAARVSYLALADVGQMLADTVIVIQDTIIETLSAMPDTVVLASAAGSPGIISLNSTISWTASPAAAWFSLNQSNGIGNASITVTSNTANTNTADRFSEVVFTDVSDPLNTDTVVIQQEGVPLQLSVTPLAVNLNFLNGSNDVLDVTSSTSWTVSNPVSWLNLSASSGTGNASITVTANSDNLTGSIRLANLTFSATGVPDVIVTVQQIDGTSPVFLFSRDTLYVDEIQGSTGTFTVLSNQASWSLSENTSWLLVNPTSGTNSADVVVLAASRNTFGNPRYGSIVGSAAGFTNDTIVIAQRSSAPLFQAAPSALSLGSDSANTVFFNISSNLLSWTLNESTSWMEVSPDSGGFSQRIEVKATEDNNSGTVRSGLIQILSPPQVPLTITVTQDTVRAIGLSENNQSEASLNIYPNPARDLVIIEGIGIDRIDLSQLQLFSANGRLISSNFVRRSANQIEVDLSSEAAGIYYLRYVHADGILSKKIILMD